MSSSSSSWYLSDSDSFATLLRTTVYATHKHGTQTRKNDAKTPYIVHPVFVCTTLQSVGINDLATLQAALLHDVVEDTKTPLSDIKKEFGTRVASIVDHVTDDKSLSKVKRKQLQIVHSHTMGDAAKLVKLADKYANLHDLKTSPPVDWSPAVVRGYFFWCYAVCEGLRNTNEKLESLLDTCFEGIVPPGITATELQREVDLYYSILQGREGVESDKTLESKAAQ